MSPAEPPPETAATAAEPLRRCPAPADFRAEVAAYDRAAEVGTWPGPRHRMTYRVLGQGPPLILIPGLASTYRGYALTLNRLAARFRTVTFDYPGEHPDDGAVLRRITHAHLVDDLFGLIARLNLGRVFPVGLSFGSTITLTALHREPRRFPKAVVQGAFAHRRFTPAERLALLFGRRMPGTVARLPLHRAVLAWNNKSHFPEILSDRWIYYLEQNGLTPIAPLAHRLDLVSRLDLRPILPQIATEILLLQGNEDRIVPRRHYDELRAGLPHATGVILPLVGHQPHYTHGEALAQAVGDFLLPCAPEGCPNEGG
ncbi:MAG TPA: alpha/beta hydrolase [Isosphaeraceae bacterium]|jgi:pimeloyl-ACP methyl ester carboxylesterase